MSLTRSSRIHICLVAVLLSVPAAISAQEAHIAGPAPAAAAQADMAPESITSKLTELVRAGRYTDARRLAIGLQAAYPADERVAKAKQMIDQLISASPSSGATPTPAAPRNDADSLTGMEKVDYNALADLAKRAKNSEDKAARQKLSNQLLNDSDALVKKHPDMASLWQLRAEAALGANAPLAGYEAGQRLIGAGAADRGDAAVLTVLAQLKNKGWLDRVEAERQDKIATREFAINNKYGWILGYWDHSSIYHPQNIVKAMVVRSESGQYEIYFINPKNPGFKRLFFRGTPTDSGDLHWEADFYNPDGRKDLPSGWNTVLLTQVSPDKTQITFMEDTSRKHPWGYVLKKTGELDGTENR